MTANENADSDMEDRLAQLWRDRVNLPIQSAAIDAFDQKVQLLRYDVAEYVADIDLRIILKRPAQNLNRGDFHAYSFVIHPVWEDGPCQHLCQTRFVRGFSDTLRKG